MFESMKDLMDTKRKITLRQPLELAQIFSVLQARVDPQRFGVAELKKGLLGASIVYPEYARVIPRITVKGNEVTLTKITNDSKTSVSVGGFSTTLDKDLRGTAALDTARAGAQYFKDIADVVTWALSDQ